MNNRFLITPLLLATIGAAACRQADATVPTLAQADRVGDVRDMGKDILNVVGKVPDGAKELGEDLTRFTGTEEAEPTILELSRRLVTALQSVSTVTTPDAEKLGALLWQGIGVQDLSERQIKTLQDQLKSTLVSLGASESNGAAVAAQVGEVQKVVNRRPRRWYEVF